MLRIGILTTRRLVGRQTDTSRVRTRPAPRGRLRRTGRASMTISTGWDREVVSPPMIVVVAICIILCRTRGLTYLYKAARLVENGSIPGIQPKNQSTGNPPSYSLKGKTPLRYRILPLFAYFISLTLWPSGSRLTELKSTTSISPGLTTYVPAFSPSTISTSDPRRFLTTPSVLG
jgi:hypothetical protein